MIDLDALKAIAEKAGEQHRPNITLPERPCLVCGIQFPCNEPWDWEPIVPGDVVSDLIDRLQAAENLLARWVTSGYPVELVTLDTEAYCAKYGVTP